MALNEEDLKFRMTIDPDTAKMQAAIKDLGKDMDDQAKRLKVSFAAMSEAGKQQLDSIRAHEKFSTAFAPQISEAEKQRLELNKQIESSFERQADVLKRINAESDPEVLRRRVTLEKELTDAKTKYQEAYAKESASQNPQEVLPVGGIKELLSQTLGGRLNLRQLGGAAIGGAIGGGPGGALGAAAGGVGAEAISGAFGPTGVAAAAAAGSLLLLVDVLKSLASTVTGLVATASPAAFKQWELAVRDLQGIIGQSLIPVLGLFRDAVRFIGDVFANILPNAHEMTQALAPLSNALRELYQELRTVLSEIGPLIREVLITNLQAAAVAMAAFATEVSVLLKILRYTTPLGLLGGDERSSKGAAAQPAHFTSLEGFEKSFQEAALGASTGQGNIQEKQLTALDKIVDLLEQSNRFFSGQDRNVHKDGNNRALFGF